MVEFSLGGGGGGGVFAIFSWVSCRQFFLTINFCPQCPARSRGWYCLIEPAGPCRGEKRCGGAPQFFCGSENEPIRWNWRSWGWGPMGPGDLLRNWDWVGFPPRHIAQICFDCFRGCGFVFFAWWEMCSDLPPPQIAADKDTTKSKQKRRCPAELRPGRVMGLLLTRPPMVFQGP